MADGSGVLSKDHWTTDPVAVIFALLFIGALAQSVMGTLEERFGIDPENPYGGGRYALGELDDTTPLGSSVRTVAGPTEVLDAPQDGAVLGTQPRGAFGALEDGPVRLGDENWWFVDFATGPDGWVPQRALRTQGTEARLAGEVPPGTRVMATFDEVGVYQAAGGGTLLGRQPAEAQGRVEQGPQIAGGEEWYRIDFASDPDGWVVGRALERTRPQLGGLSEASELGTRVRAAVDTELLAAPGGAVAGFVRKGLTGALIGGPVSLEGLRFWQVEFSDGQVGWLPESALEAIPFAGLRDLWTNVRFWFSVLAFTYSALLAAIIGFVLMRLTRVRREEMLALWRGLPDEPTIVKDTRWQEIERMVASDQPSAWRQAILEADIILDEMVSRLGYPGET
ncbi:hypothetical protein GVX82_01420, partial [Patescibacteria group bacterium]|nr:hypothetical protein [Patescibacteria group bacterium]